jgi:hypothetical protein
MNSRIIVAAAVLAAASLVACDESAKDGPATADSADTASPSGPRPTDAATTDPNEPLAMDSVPLRTPAGGPARFHRRSGYLRYQYTGDLVGMREIWFDDYGMLERRTDSAFIVGEQLPPQISIMIGRRDSFAIISPAERTTTMIPNKGFDEYLKSDSGKSRSLAEMIFRGSGGRRLPNETIKGMPVSVVQLDQGEVSTRVSVWQGIVLREEVRRQDGKGHKVEIDSMAFDIEVPKSKFDTPKGYTVQQRQPGAPREAQGAPPPGMPRPGGPPAGGARPPMTPMMPPGGR